MKKVILSLTSILVYTTFSVAQTVQDGLRYIEMEQYGNARKTFLSLVSSNPTNAEYLYYMGDFYLQLANIDIESARPDSALVFFERGIAANPKFALNYVGKGAAKYMMGNWDESSALFAQAVSMGKKNAQVYCKIAEAYIYNGKKDIAVALPQIQKAVELNPKNIEYHLLLADAYLLADDGSGTRAIKECNEALKVNPKSAKALMQAAVIYRQAKSYDNALTYINQAIDADPTFSPAYRVRAELYFKLKKYRDQAPAEYKKYLDMSDGNFNSKFRFAYFLFKNENYKESLEQLTLLQEQYKSDKYIYRLMGYSSYLYGITLPDTSASKPLYLSGLASLRKFMEMSPDTNTWLASDYEYLGKLLLKTGDLEGGATVLKKVIAKDTTKYEVYNDLAKLYKERKNYLASANYMESYFQYKSPTLNELVSLGTSYYFAKEYVKSDTVFSKILAQKPEELIGWKWRARCNEAQDPDAKLGLAVALYEKYIELASAKDALKYKSDIIGGYKYIGKYYLQAKNYSKSKSYWRKISELDPEDADAKSVLSKLASVK